MSNHMYKLGVNFDCRPQEETVGEVASSPPESSFQKLAPSETRYTILSRERDELWPQRPSFDSVPRLGVREGVSVGTGQRDRTATPNTLTEERERERCEQGRTERRRRRREWTAGGREEERNPWRNHVGITYIFITLSHTVFILD